MIDRLRGDWGVDVNTGEASIRGLQEALARCERAAVNYAAYGRDIGTIDVLLTPKDVAKRQLHDIWHLARPKFYLGEAGRWKGTELADGIAAGAVGLPDMCARCLGEPTQGIVWEMLGRHLERVTGRWAGDERSLIATNRQRVWYSVPFCQDCADRHTDTVAFGETMFDSGWIAFRNREYGTAFGELNGLRPRTAVRRFWPAPMALILIMAMVGLMSLLAYFGVMSTEYEPTSGHLVGGMVLTALAVVGLAVLSRVVLAPWRRDWRNDRTLP